MSICLHLHVYLTCYMLCVILDKSTMYRLVGRKMDWSSRVCLATFWTKSFMNRGPGQRKPCYSYQDHRPHLRSWLCLTWDHSGCRQRTWSYIAGSGGGWQSTSRQWLEGWQELVLLLQRRSRWSERIVGQVTCLLWFETTRYEWNLVDKDMCQLGHRDKRK